MHAHPKNVIVLGDSRHSARNGGRVPRSRHSRASDMLSAPGMRLQDRHLGYVRFEITCATSPSTSRRSDRKVVRSNSFLATTS